MEERKANVAHVSHKLSTSFEGALAGGGDPATSPLYVFGPFLKLVVLAGVARVTFGASIWLVVLTIAVVSAMYRLVMQWVTDGSGGSGLSEEEFGSWAVKVNAAITFIEYTLTFLVSMSAMVTFIADRFEPLNTPLALGIQIRDLVAIALSVLTGWLVNRGPKMAARTFGPATAGVLVLLWAMIISTIINTWESGVRLPGLDFRAFNSQYLGYTIGGYVRILAVMTGIEVFANLVAAYDGPPTVKSRKAFSSLLIIMGTTAATMIVVGPAILDMSDPSLEHISVFTQTMDRLLPEPLPYVGTIVGILVLMSASAASAQGLQNLSLGLRRRHYVPPIFGQRNRFQVADKPVWLEVAIVSLCFLLFGTREETYLAIYAAGVFILLSMTGWAVTKRLVREVREDASAAKIILIGGTVLASLLTTSATGIIFFERFLEGAWTYLLFIPVLYAIFSFSRTQMGDPTPEMDYLGQLDAAQLAGFGFGQVSPIIPAAAIRGIKPLDVTWQPAPKTQSRWREEEVTIQRIVTLLDGSFFAAQALPMVKSVSKATGARLTLLSSVKDYSPALMEQYEDTALARRTYLQAVSQDLKADGYNVDYYVRPGFIANATQALVAEKDIDLVVTSTRGKSGAKHWLSGGASSKLVEMIDKPILLVQASDVENGNLPKLDKILVALDGSIYSEQVLPYARAFAQAYGSELILMTVPAVPQVEDYRAPSLVVETIRGKAEVNMGNFLSAVARSLEDDGLVVRPMVTGSIPVQTILKVSEDEDVDMIMITSQGRGGIDLLMMGSVAQRLVQNTDKPVFMVPIQDHQG
jgi:nucleotide-binding universal stress UspA family protein